MKLLLDTHSLIWFLNGDEKLTTKVKNAIEDPKNEKFVSVASIWEIAIKISLDKFRFPRGFKNFLSLIEDNGFEMVPITMEHALILSTLDFIHRDPFDRLMISQCKANNMILATKDEFIKKYQIQTLW